MRRAVLIAIGLVTVTVLVTGAAWSQYSGTGVGAKSTVVLQTTQTVIGQDIEYPLLKPEVTSLLVEIAPGGQTGRHMHPVTEFAYVLEGTLTVAIDGQGEKVFMPGQGFVEARNTWHTGMNRETTPVKVLAVFVGEQGTPNVIRP